jgi:hypothetical protein
MIRALLGEGRGVTIAAQGSPAPIRQASLPRASLTQAGLTHRLGSKLPPSVPVTTWRQVIGLLVDVMAWIAAATELLMEKYSDCVILLGIILVNASTSFYGMRKSGNAVDGSRPSSAAASASSAS